MTPTSFNLIDRPWIRVRNSSGLVEELSLRETLTQAHALRGLAGEIPTQDVAVLRVLLAVLLGATRPSEPRTDLESIDHFRRWWEAGAFPMEVLEPYLARVHDRFDLLDDAQPFYQVAGLTTASGKRTGLSKLIAEVPAGHPFFTTRAASEVESLSLAEAARWLVHCMAFDPSGIKTGAAGDDRVKGGKGYPFGYPAWAGNLGPVVAHGTNLFETLMLNTPWTMSGPADIPLWERLPNGPGVDDDHPSPFGPADMFTWPSRRLRLFITGDRVTDVQISNGDKLGPQNLHPFEAMSAWRYSKAQSKGGSDVLMPVQHDPARRIWQGLGSLLLRSDQTTGGLRAPVIEWMASLKYEGALPDGLTVNLQVCGFEYGTQNSVITGAVDDRLVAAASALTDPSVAQAMVDAATQAKDGVVALANLAGNLDRAAGGDGNARERTFEIGYSLLDRPFRAWVTQLSDEDHLAQDRAQWAATASAILRRAGDDLIRDVSPAAIVGRSVTPPGKDKPILLDAGLAHLWFQGALVRTFPSDSIPEQETP